MLFDCLCVIDDLNWPASIDRLLVLHRFSHPDSFFVAFEGTDFVCLIIMVACLHIINRLKLRSLHFSRLCMLVRFIAVVSAFDLFADKFIMDEYNAWACRTYLLLQTSKQLRTRMDRAIGDASQWTCDADWEEDEAPHHWLHRGDAVVAKLAITVLFFIGSPTTWSHCIRQSLG